MLNDIDLDYRIHRFNKFKLFNTLGNEVQRILLKSLEPPRLVRTARDLRLVPENVWFRKRDAFQVKILQSAQHCLSLRKRARANLDQLAEVAWYFLVAPKSLYVLGISVLIPAKDFPP